MDAIREGGRFWKLVNFALLQAAWFGCVLSAAAGRPALACAAALAALGVHFALVRDRGPDLRMIAIAVPLGIVTDTIVRGLGAFDAVADPVPHPFPPSWFPLLWAVFAAALRHSMAWMRGRLVVAAVLGAIGGPLSLASGARLGGVTVTGDPVLFWTVVGAQWAIAMPALVRLS